MVNKAKALGTAAETALLRWLHQNGHKDAVRNPPAGTKDVGDITVGGWDRYDPIVVEVKNHANLATAINDGLAELDVEMVNAGTSHGVLVVKRRGKGDPGQWLAIRRVKNDPEIGGL